MAGPSFLFGWEKPQKIGNSGPAIVQAIRKIGQRYSMEGADRARIYAPVDTSLFQKSITAQPDRAEKLTWWVGSSLPYASRLEFLWFLGMPHSKNRNPSASAHCISRGVCDISGEFGKACSRAMRGEWGKIV